MQAAFLLTGRLVMAPVVPADGAPYRVEEPMESWERGSDFGGDGSVHSYPRRDYSQDTRHRAGETELAAQCICSHAHTTWPADQVWPIPCHAVRKCWLPLVRHKRLS